MPGGTLWRFLWLRLVKFRWSHEQIAATLRAKQPKDRQARVCHKTIYHMIYAEAPGGLKAALVEALRQGKHRHGLGWGIGRKPGGDSAIAQERLKILHRSEKVGACLIPGHREVDLINGPATARQSASCSNARPALSHWRRWKETGPKRRWRGSRGR